MDALILEVTTRGLHRYFNLDKAVTRIGRALDNDIILSDPTVAAYHLRISFEENDHLLIENLAEINPTKINDRPQNRLETTRLPVKLQLGRVVANIMPRDHTVAATRPLAGHDRGLQLFNHGGWAILLPVVCLLVGSLQFYLGSYTSLKWEALIGYVIRETAVNLALLIIVLSVVERLLVNRWEVKLVTICVSMTYLLFRLLHVIVDQAMYLLSSQWPATLFGIGWYLFFIPTAIALYLINISHFKARQSIVLAILISSPFSVPALLKNPIMQYMTNDFSTSANYHKTLSPLNWHWSETVSIDIFIQQAENLEAGQFVN